MRDWRNRAACRDHDPDLFFPVGTKGPAIQQARTAQAVCRKCPVRSDCLEAALSVGDHGVWGGLTPDQLKDARKRVRR